MSSMSYNPNTNIPSYNSYQSSNNYNNIEQSNMMPQSNMMQQSNMMPQQSNMMPQQSNMSNMMPHQSNMSNMMPQQSNMNNSIYSQYTESPQPTMLKSSLKQNNIESFTNNKVNWFKIGKSIIIYTFLFLILSTSKINDLICKFIPLVKDNEIICMTIKGVIFSIIILVLNKIIV